jgi:NAD(P)-dependent dehydrogenase (short-subunit alcohol dehydrogenase family)
MKGRVAFITGGSSGIGLAAAQLLAKQGVKVGVNGKDEDETREAVAGIKADGGEAMPLVADVSDPAQVKQAIENLVAQYDRLDVVFANAGVNGTWAPLEDLTPEEWQQTLNINLAGTFYTLKYALPYLKRQGGSVIITSSVNGTRMFSNSGASAYATSKAGQVAFAKMVALELAKDKIRVNVICPGAIETPINEKTEKRNLENAGWPSEFPKGAVPLTHGQPGKPEDVANLVLFLASDQSSLISGTEIWIDGTESLLQG